MFSEKKKAEIMERFKEMDGEFPQLLEGAKEEAKRLDEKERLALFWLYTAMPLSDAANYPASLFVDFAVFGTRLWEQSLRVQNLPEEIFLQYVLSCRVNEEELRPCRRLFAGELLPGIEGLSEEEAVLKVNLWCAGQAAYQSTDDRTSSALAVYERGFGRCGEESVFCVNAMRSVGIPARQVYVPQWSHCDDNHAWVEVWCRGEWKFLGACEPEPVLNRGWFNRAASRAMIVHARVFDRPESSVLDQEDRIGRQGADVTVNQLRRYARGRTVRVVVLDQEGRRAGGARVSFQVLNTACFLPVAQAEADGEGEVLCYMGLGSLLIRAEKDGVSGEMLADTRTAQVFTVVLEKDGKEREWEDVDFDAPGESVSEPILLSEEEKEEKRRLLMEAAACRSRKREGGKNLEAERFFRGTKGEGSLRRRIFMELSPKDRTDCLFDCLEEHMEDLDFFREKGFAETSDFISYVANPRVGNEILRPYQRQIREAFSGEEIYGFCQEPERLWDWIDSHIRSVRQRERSSLLTAPAACLRTRTGSQKSKQILFVAAARSFGLGARINPVDGTPEYMREGRFMPAKREWEKNARLILESGDGTEWIYFQNWSLAKLTQEGYAPLHLEQESWKDGTLDIALSQGRYRLVTALRLPGGNIRARKREIVLMEGETRKEGMSLRKADFREMLQSQELPCICLRDEEGRRVSDFFSRQKPDRKIFMWLSPGQEPTEHVLNEMLQAGKAFARIQGSIIFVLETPEAAEDPLLAKVLGEFPKIQAFFDSFEENVEMYARRMYVDPDQLPLIIVAEAGDGVAGIYGVSGYQVGTGSLLLRLMEEQKE